MKISVIIPYYNAEKYISECLASFLNQTMDDFEVIIVDDGSEAPAKDYLINLISEINSIILVSQPNMNASVARNHALSIARGEYVLFLGSDDYLIDNNILEKMYQDVDGYDLLMGNYIEFEGESILKTYRVKEDFFYNSISSLKYVHLSPSPSNKRMR